MSTKTAIEWTEATWNPVTGCTKVSQGCKHCYAERDWSRLSRIGGNVYTGRSFGDVMCHPERLGTPLRWKKSRRIFVNSMSDLFHEAIPDDFIVNVFDAMALAARHTFQVLTKRPERMIKLMPRLAERYTCRDGSGWPLTNVWLGVSVEDQETADARLPLLLQTPAAVRWVSAEPLLSEVDLRAIDLGELYWLDAFTGQVHIAHDGGMPAAKDYRPLDWVVVGGESGPKARPTHPEWVRFLRDQCQAVGTPFFFKQWGEWAPGQKYASAEWDGGAYVEAPGGQTAITRAHDFGPDQRWAAVRVGKKAAGCILDGRTWQEYPQP